MSQIRTFNVLTLTTILFLAGCFGMGDSAEAADEHEHTPNAAPVLETGYASIEECNSASCNASIYHAAVDPDGDLIDIGYDFDLDGTIDFTLIDYRGFTDLQIPVTEFETVPANTTEDVETSSCVNDQQLVSTTTTTNSELITTIALIAVDSNDAASAELITMGATVVTSSTTVTTTVECTSVWSFSHRDANGDMSSDGLDDLVHIQMTSGDGLNWANLKVSIVVDGGVSSLCVEGGDAATSYCTWEKDGDNIWDVADEITISEGDTSLCDGTDPCSVVVTLTKVGVGADADRVIATVFATGESTVGGQNTYTFSHRDANGDMSETGGDALVHVQMTGGYGLNWANLKVSIVVDGGVSALCTEGADGTQQECSWDRDEDNIWDVAEEITISEGTTDLCDGVQPCEVVVTLTKVGVGEEDDRVIASITATAENN